MIPSRLDRAAIECRARNGLPPLPLAINDYLRAARVPMEVQPQDFGLWRIIRRYPEGAERAILETSRQTMLCRITEATLHHPFGEIVMDDSMIELRRHLPFWLTAKQGNILVTGLGLGCVVRGLLINPKIERIDVIEIDPKIIAVIGPEFENDPRVTIHLGDALKLVWSSDTHFDFAWHDIWTEGDKHLQLLHTELITKYLKLADVQGAWMLPRFMKRRLRAHGLRIIG